MRFQRRHNNKIIIINLSTGTCLFKCCRGHIEVIYMNRLYVYIMNCQSVHCWYLITTETEQMLFSALWSSCYQRPSLMIHQNVCMTSTRVYYHSGVYQWSCCCSSQMRKWSISLSVLPVGGRHVPYPTRSHHTVTSSQSPAVIAAGRSKLNIAEWRIHMDYNRVFRFTISFQFSFFQQHMSAQPVHAYRV